MTQLHDSRDFETLPSPNTLHTQFIFNVKIFNLIIAHEINSVGIFICSHSCIGQFCETFICFSKLFAHFALVGARWLDNFSLSAVCIASSIAPCQHFISAWSACFDNSDIDTWYICGSTHSSAPFWLTPPLSLSLTLALVRRGKLSRRHNSVPRTNKQKKSIKNIHIFNFHCELLTRNQLQKW